MLPVAYPIKAANTDLDLPDREIQGARAKLRNEIRIRSRKQCRRSPRVNGFSGIISSDDLAFGRDDGPFGRDDGPFGRRCWALWAAMLGPLGGGCGPFSDMRLSACRRGSKGY